MSVKRKHPKMSLGDAMKAAKKTYKKTRKGGAFAPSTNGHAAQLPYDKPSTAPDTAVGANGTFTMGGTDPVGFGGRRRRSTKKAGRRRRGGGSTQGAAAVYGAASSEASAAARQAAAARNGFE
jgi:hypothetical protein